MMIKTPFKKLLKRILTGLILVFIGTFFIFSDSMILLSSLLTISIFICYECHSMAFFKQHKKGKPSSIVSYFTCLLIALTAYGFIWVCFLSNYQLSLILKIGLCFLPVLCAITELSFKKIFFSHVSHFLRFRIGFISGFCLPFVFVLHNHSKTVTFVALSSIFLTDTIAYFGGNYFGKTMLCKLSPKKTKEGAICGVFAATVLGILYCLWTKQSMLIVFIFSLCSVVSQIGDLHESLFKRWFDTKDSGSILPGHGGFYDRFDSALLGAPFFLGCFLIFDFFGLIS